MGQLNVDPADTYAAADAKLIKSIVTLVPAADNHVSHHVSKRPFLCTHLHNSGCMIGCWGVHERRPNSCIAESVGRWLCTQIAE